MSNEILDVAEKYKGPRTCPECGHKFPFWKFVSRFVRSYGLSTWPCKGCQITIKCDFIKIQFLWMIGFVAYGVLFGVLTYFFDLDLPIFLSLIPFFAFTLVTLFYAKFEKLEKPSN